MDLSLVLPALNEAENLPPLLKNTKAVLDNLAISYEIIVVDNGSSDNTAEVLELLKKEIPELKTVIVPRNIGFGNGILQGLYVSQGKVLGFMDADGQIEPRCLAEVYLNLKTKGLDFCKGVRLTRGDGWLRYAASKAYNLLFKLLFGGNINDLGGKPKVFTREFYEKVAPISKDWFLDTEIAIKMIKQGGKMEEMPNSFLVRSGGRSKVRLSTVWEFLKNMFYWRFFKNY